MKKILTIWIAFLSVMAVSAMTREEVDAQVDSAYNAAMAGQLEQAISINMDALALVPMDSTGWKCEFYSCLLYCYHRLGDYTEALRYGELCLQYDEQHGTQYDLSVSLGNLAGIYSSAGKQDVAIENLYRIRNVRCDFLSVSSETITHFTYLDNWKWRFASFGSELLASQSICEFRYFK